MRERRRGGEAAPRGPQALDVLFVLGETRDRRAASNDPVGVADVRRDLIGRALHLDEEDGGHARSGRDRKSTRLNSSHVRISYAVFCLKKKRTASVNAAFAPSMSVPGPGHRR